MQLTDLVFQTTESMPRSERFELISQIRRSAVSIPSNIAEGCGRQSPPDFARFLRIAYASSCELETQLRIVARNNMGDGSKLETAIQDCERIRRMLSPLISKLTTIGNSRGSGSDRIPKTEN